MARIVICIVLAGMATLIPGRSAACSVGDIHPAYPPVNATPAVEATDVSPPGGGNCFPDSAARATWVTVAATIQTPLSPEAIIERFGAISELQQVQYWSTTDQAWRPMVSAAFAVSSANNEQRRADYSSAELVGPARYYRITDTRTYEAVNYSLAMHPSPHGQIFVETTNVDSVRKWGITLYHPDGLHTFYFLSERSPGVWSYYSITRAVPATFLARGHEKSYVNRAMALYRHYLRLPATAAPPAAR
jgi:hypothetical protein